MAETVLTTKLNVVEQAKRRAGGNVVNIAEVLAQTNDILKYAPMKEANDVFSHLETIRTKLPTITPRNINNGAGRSASGTKQVRESLMLLDVFCEVDEQLIDHEPDPKKALLNEIKTFLEAATQTFAHLFFYGNPGDDSRECLGLHTRFLSKALANVHTAGGSGSDLTSVWMIEWDELVMSLIYPKGSKSVGITEKDNGKTRITDSSGNPYMAYSHQVKLEFGLSIPDSRGCQRIGDIESEGTSNNLMATAGMRHLIYARNRLPKAGKNAVMFCNRDVKSQFDMYALEKANGFYPVNDLTGGPLTTFQGIPILMAEQILSTESALSA